MTDKPSTFPSRAGALFFCLLVTGFASHAFAAKQAVSVISIDPQAYTSTSGEVFKYPQKRLVMYGSRSLVYSFEIDRNAEYLVQLSTAQVSSKPKPPEQYRFLFDILVDGQRVVSGAPLSAEKSYVLSDMISLGKLAPGVHAMTLKWTNDEVTEEIDANLGIGSIEIFRV